jgi:hypothetical protein
LALEEIRVTWGRSEDAERSHCTVCVWEGRRA